MGTGRAQLLGNLDHGISFLFLKFNLFYFFSILRPIVLLLCVALKGRAERNEVPAGSPAPTWLPGPPGKAPFRIVARDAALQFVVDSLGRALRLTVPLLALEAALLGLGAPPLLPLTVRRILKMGMWMGGPEPGEGFLFVFRIFIWRP